MLRLIIVIKLWDTIYGAILELSGIQSMLLLVDFLLCNSSVLGMMTFDYFTCRRSRKTEYDGIVITFLVLIKNTSL